MTPESQPHVRGVLVGIALGTLLAPLNSTMIAVALPRIVDDFDTTIGTVGWLVTTYLLALAVVQPVAGKLGDRYGRRPFVIGGLVVFGAASVGAAVAPSLALLIAFRVAQAVSGAVVFPNGAGLIRELVPADRRGGAFGVVGGSVALAAGVGPLLGGLLLTVGGWRAIFLVNVPVVAAAIVICWWAVPRAPGRASASRFDWPGAALLAAVLVGSAMLVIEGRHAPATLLPGLAILTVLGVAFVRRELRHPDPVLQPRFFAKRAFAGANAAIATSNLAFYTVLLAIPVLLTRRLGWSSLEIGFALAFLSAPMVVFSPIGGRLADRLGRRRPSFVGCVLLAAGLAPFVFGPDLNLGLMLACLVPDGGRGRTLDRGVAGVGDRGARTARGRRRCRRLLDLALRGERRRLDRARPPTRQRTRARRVRGGVRDGPRRRSCVGRVHPVAPHPPADRRARACVGVEVTAASRAPTFVTQADRPDTAVRRPGRSARRSR